MSVMKQQAEVLEVLKKAVKLAIELGVESSEITDEVNEVLADVIRDDCQCWYGPDMDGGWKDHECNACAAMVTS